MSDPEGIVFLCGDHELDKERRGYARAFARIAPLRLIAPGDDWRARLGDTRPILILNPDGIPWLPDGIERVDAPTAVFHIDTYVATSRRIVSSAMYDYAFVFHPGFEHEFRRAGIAGARLLPHAAEGDLFEGPEVERHFDVGWVGRSRRSIYGKRDRILHALASRFVTNDIARSYTPEEMADVYRASRIVVNVSRDDHPRDANMRCFEAMAAGSLLISGTPTELTDLGFAENVHFAAYRAESEVADVVAHWLERDEERRAITQRARALVLREHTYDARVQTILRTIQGGRIAPARTWSAARTEASRFSYHVEYANTRPALRVLRRLIAASPARAARESWRLSRLAAKLIRARWRR